ncbi:protein kinase [Kitasatospora sp. NPDC049285]|uniref:protein kinase domain-containing protein n=1 Tax=Kitasatospora sp. NPDC049285 TaxID=3157096 RepID=UPI00343C5125
MERLGTDDPSWIGEYRLLRRLGAGGMGRVYLGRTAGGRTVAVKAVRSELADDPEFRARFRQEVAAARQVGGRWTAPVLDADTEGPRPWVATGYVAGPSLGTAVRGGGPLPTPAVHALGAWLAEALEQVHTLGLVHRDVKPSNVLLTLDGPRLIDFGVARALDAATALTHSGYVVGSPGFMSPEQAGGRPVGPAGDVFSLGALLAFAATGKAPFGEGVSAAVLLYRVIHEEPELTGLHGELAAVVADCLAKDPARRPTPAELRARLAPGAAGAVGPGGWLPPALAAAVGRAAVELLDLEAEPPLGTPAAGTPATGIGANGPSTDLPSARVPSADPVGSGVGGPTGPGGFADRMPTVLDGGPGGAPDAVTSTGRARRNRIWGAVAAVAVLVATVFGTLAATDNLPWQAEASSSHSPGQDQADGGSNGADASDDPSASASDEPSGTADPSPRTGSSAAPVGSTGSPAVSGNGKSLPDSFLGTWKGPITTKIVPLESNFTVTFTGGKVGEQVGRTSNASELSDTVCAGVLTLLSAEPGKVVLQERSDGDGAGCTGAPEKQTYTAASDGTSIHLQVSEAPLGSDPAGDLRKQG